MPKQTTPLPDPVEEEEETSALDLVHGLDDSEISVVFQALDEENYTLVESIIRSLSVQGAVDLLNKASENDREDILKRYARFLDPYVFSELDPELRRACLSVLTPDAVARIVSELDSDDALDLILPLEEDARKEIIRKLSYKDRIALEEGLAFPEESAGRLMQREFVAIPQFWTVGKVIDYLRAADETLPDEFFDLFVVNPDNHVVGEIPLSRLVRARRSEKLEDLSLESTHPIPATMDQEEVAYIFKAEDLTSAPVVDDEDRLIGVITIDDVVDVITEEAQEDIMKLGGAAQGDIYRDVGEVSFLRGRWLLVNLLTALLASAVISLFEGTIDKLVALAVLMPIVASMGGNAGTQTLTVAVRALATRELSSANAWRVIGKETLIGVINGGSFAVLTGIVAGLWFQNAMLGVVIGIAMIINLIAAGLFGALIPIGLEKLGADPAVSSTVFLTTVTDVVGFFAFLGLASIFLL